MALKMASLRDREKESYLDYVLLRQEIPLSALLGVGKLEDNKITANNTHKTPL